MGKRRARGGRLLGRQDRTVEDREGAGEGGGGGEGEGLGSLGDTCERAGMGARWAGGKEGAKRRRRPRRSSGPRSVRACGRSSSSTKRCSCHVHAMLDVRCRQARKGAHAVCGRARGGLCVSDCGGGCLTMMGATVMGQAWPFMEPVDADALKIPDYHTIITYACSVLHYARLV